MEALGCPSEMLLFRDADEIAQMPQLHLIPLRYWIDRNKLLDVSSRIIANCYGNECFSNRAIIEARGGPFMSTHVTISPSEAADRLAIRELVEAYAHCADRRDARGQMALFTPDTHFVVYMNAKDPTPSQELYSREALAPVFADLNQYAATTHFLGQSTITSLSDNRAAGEAYCLAHHVTVAGSARRLMIASLRYNDTFVKADGRWLFSERLLYVDWVDERSLS
jgi:hypothetical protein